MQPSIARKLWELLTPAERRRALALLGMLILGMAFETLGIGLVVPALAILTQPNYTARFPAVQSLLASLGNPDRQTLIVGAMACLTAVYFVKNAFLAFVTWAQMRFAFSVQAELSHRLFTIYLRQPYTFHLQRNSAQLLRNATAEVSLFANNAIVPGLLLLSEGLVLIGLCALLFVVQPAGAVTIFGVLGTSGFVFYRLTRRRIGRWGTARQFHDGESYKHLAQGLGGAKDVKVLGREREFLEQFNAHNVKAAHVGHRQATLLQFPRLWLEVLAMVGLALLVFTMLAQGQSVEAVLPTLGLFAAAAFRVMPSVNRVLNAIQTMRYGLPVISTLHAEAQLEAPPPVRRSAEVTRFHEVLALRNVSFTYPGAGQPALRDMSIEVRRGESVGFIGSSGAGKSTLVDILLGLLTPDSGVVSMDDQDIQRDVRNWQDQIGYVPQSIFLTDDTLRRNVAFGLPDDQIDESAVRRALRAAQLEEFVGALPEGLETVVGERGIRLSGGQRQRIGIARALYHDPAVLVLDEATSSLDTATERGVMEAVTALHGAKTVIIVAHRTSTVEHCDRLYRLELGAVVEAGTPESILSARRKVQSG